MTTRGGESWDIVDTVESQRPVGVSVEDILRPLAEQTVACSECHGDGQRTVIGQGTVRNMTKSLTVASCPATVPDPRFEALRRRFTDEEIVYFRSGGASGMVTGKLLRGVLSAWRIDASLGTMRRVEVACGVKRMETSYTFAGWETLLWREDGFPGRGTGESVEEAEAKALVALVAAVGDEKRRVVTP